MSSDTDPAILQPVSFSDIPQWSDEDHLAAFQAFLPTAKKMQETAYKTRAFGISGSALQRAGLAALSLTDLTDSLARDYFETNFVPHLLTQPEESGFVTGFFEPLVKASRTRSEQFSVPLYKRPNELIDLDDSNRPVEMDPYFRFGRLIGEGIEEYFDRPAIQNGALDGKDLELVWLKNKVDALFIHVQGSAKLILENDDVMRVTYAAKSGHQYTSVAKVLCKQTGTAPEQMTADRLADWMHANPEQIDSLLAHNQSYIFFKTIEGLEPDDGPIAAAKTPLIAGRSLAVDKKLHTFGCPIWLTTNEPLPGDAVPFAKLMFAHDTGSAIVGPARGDVFVGTGKEAGLVAGKIRHSATFTVLVPRKNHALSESKTYHQTRNLGAIDGAD